MTRLETDCDRTRSTVHQRSFLTAQWRWLVMLNYKVDARLLESRVPRGTELDLWHGDAYVSVVGFLFQDTKLLGLPIPFHRRFEEINLRFYVRRQVHGEERRGVVFIKEICPRGAVTFIAGAVYNENYVTRPMRHRVELVDGAIAPGCQVRYQWADGGHWHTIGGVAASTPAPLIDGSEAQFITEHYWGYCTQRDGGCVEYEVEHPSWQVCSLDNVMFDANVARIYGPEFVPSLSAPPSSAFLADGSAICVRRGLRIS